MIFRVIFYSVEITILPAKYRNKFLIRCGHALTSIGYFWQFVTPSYSFPIWRFIDWNRCVSMIDILQYRPSYSPSTETTLLQLKHMKPISQNSHNPLFRTYSGIHSTCRNPQHPKTLNQLFTKTIKPKASPQLYTSCRAHVGWTCGRVSALPLVYIVHNSQHRCTGVPPRRLYSYVRTHN